MRSPPSIPFIANLRLNEWWYVLKQIILWALYPDASTEDTLWEAAAETLVVFLDNKKAQAAYKRQLYRHPALLTLDNTKAVKSAVMQNPEENIENRQLSEHLHFAPMTLPGK